MPGRYTSFLIRHWQLAGGARRITVEHVQSGERVTVASIDAAASWLTAQADDAPPPADDPPPAAADRCESGQAR
jgi:hypothetical protein